MYEKNIIKCEVMEMCVGVIQSSRLWIVTIGKMDIVFLMFLRRGFI